VIIQQNTRDVMERRSVLGNKRDITLLGLGYQILLDGELQTHNSRVVLMNRESLRAALRRVLRRKTKNTNLNWYLTMIRRQ